MKKHPMLNYDAGQILIKVSDELSEASRDLKDGGFPKLAKICKSSQLEIGKAFNDLRSHVFGLQEEERPDPRDEELEKLRDELKEASYCRDCEQAERTIKMLEAKVQALTKIVVEMDLIKPTHIIIRNEDLK